EAWYDAHENKHDIYSGYWSFESGAIAKILKLDDSTLKDSSYYPYDMVHCQEK
ncbi:PoNe immunity protein domain-containing protein, partial [Bacillus toyonensis]